MRFDYRDGQIRASGPPDKVTDLPSEINHHWTKALTASPDGRFLYVGIGSNSNITERGMAAEVDRAMVWQVDAKTGAHKPYATGLRNPTALAIQPGTNQLWAVVNERDELGPNLVPDYLTSVREGGFADGVFVGEHGSWNREEPVGYKVIFVPFRNGRPAAPPVRRSTSSPASTGRTAKPAAGRSA